MFFKKKNKSTIHVLTLGGNAAACKNAAMSLSGPIGGSDSVMISASNFQEEIERQVKKRLANEKFNNEFLKLPEYRISESYDVKTHKDTYFLERKQRQFRSGFSSTTSPIPDFDVIWERVYASETKEEVTKRFNRVMPKKVARKKAA